jgi:membrane protease YdiL (CAAX protease family)
MPRLFVIPQDYRLGHTRRESYGWPMSPVRSLLIYAGGVFLGGGLLSPWLAWGVQSLAAHYPVFQKLADHPFHFYVNRSLLLLALVGLVPLLRSLGVSVGRDVGLVKPAGQGRNLCCGFAVGFASLAGIAVVVLMAGAREVNSDISADGFFERVSGTAITAAVVALIEEVLFRGAIFGALRKTVRWPVAMVISSAIYALVHFFSRPPSPSQIHFTSGLAVLPTMLGGFVDVEKVIPGFFNLTLAGALLAMAYQHTGNLYFSIGLHAGWIFWLKSYGFLTREAANASAWFWGTNRLIDGWLALIDLALVSLLLLKLWPRAAASNTLPRQ